MFLIFVCLGKFVIEIIIIWNRNKIKTAYKNVFFEGAFWTPPKSSSKNAFLYAPELATASKILKLTTHFKNYDEVLVSIILFFNCISFQVGK